MVTKQLLRGSVEVLPLCRQSRHKDTVILPLLPSAGIPEVHFHTQELAGCSYMSGNPQQFHLKN